MRASLLYTFGLLMFMVAFTASASDSLDNVRVIDLQDDWLVYNKEYNAYFPLLPSDKRNHTSISQSIDLDKNAPYRLNFLAEPGLSLFINGKLIYKNYSDVPEYVKIGIDTLLKGRRGTEKELLTFFNPSKGELPYGLFYIGNTTDKKINLAGIAPAHILPRALNQSSTLYILTFLIILTAIALLKNRYPKKFFELFRFSNVLPEVDENMIWDISSVPVILFVVINSFCASLILFVIKKEYDLDSLDFLNIFKEKSVLGILAVSAGFFMIYIVKYIQLKVLGWIFNLKEIVKYQFFELMKVSLKINMFLAVLILIFYSSSFFNVSFDFDYFLYFTLLSLLIVLLRVGYLTFTLSGFRNIYLFSYLCTTEILPLIIIVKLILF